MKYGIEDAFIAQDNGVVLALSCGSPATINRADNGVIYLQGIGECGSIEELTNKNDMVSVYVPEEKPLQICPYCDEEECTDAIDWTCGNLCGSEDL